MNILLDTNIFLWLSGVDGRPSNRALKIFRDSDTQIFISTVSAWEIAIKWSKGRLTLPGNPRDFMSSVLKASGMTMLPVTFDDAIAVADLPWHHRDPFDRLLVVQARNKGLTLLTSDTALEEYDIDVVLTNRLSR